MRRIFVLLAVLCLIFPAAFARKHHHDQSKNQKSASKDKLVDSGTFAIFQNGHKMATETFSIHQYPTYNVTSAETQIAAGPSGKVLQESAQLTLSPNGSLMRYELKQESPIHRTLTVTPSQHILVMHSDIDGKKSTQLFFLTPSDFILDDYFFSSREVLLWRYMATSCKPDSNGEGCTLIRRRYPVLIPQRNTSSQVFIRFKGYENTPMNGRPQRLRHFVMQTGGPTWNLWLNAKMKLMRISIPSANIEVLRQ